MLHGKPGHRERFPILLKALREGQSSDDALATGYPHILPDEWDDLLATHVRPPDVKAQIAQEQYLPQGICLRIPPAHHADDKPAQDGRRPPRHPGPAGRPRAGRPIPPPLGLVARGDRPRRGRQAPRPRPRPVRAPHQAHPARHRTADTRPTRRGPDGTAARRPAARLGWRSKCALEAAPTPSRSLFALARRRRERVGVRVCAFSTDSRVPDGPVRAAASPGSPSRRGGAGPLLSAGAAGRAGPAPAGPHGDHPADLRATRQRLASAGGPAAAGCCRCQRTAA